MSNAMLTQTRRATPRRRSCVIRDTTMRARQPIRQAAERVVQGRVVEGHQGRGPTMRVENLGAPAERGELRHLDPVIAAIDLLDELMRGRSQGRQHSRNEVGILAIHRSESSETGHEARCTSCDPADHGQFTQDLFSTHASPQLFHQSSTCFPQHVSRPRSATVRGECFSVFDPIGYAEWILERADWPSLLRRSFATASIQ